MSVFDHWELDGVNVSSDETYTFTPNADVTLRAVFTTRAGRPEVGKYYRIRNVGNRALTLDGGFEHSASNGSDIPQALMRWTYPLDTDMSEYFSPGFDASDAYEPMNVEAAPGTIFYIYDGKISGDNLSNSYMESQGVKSKTFASYSFTFTPMDNSFYGYYGIQVSSAGLKNFSRDDIGGIVNVTTFSTADYMCAYAFQPIDEEHIDEYWFGVKPDQEMEYDGGLWSSMYTAFPYECRDGVEAYYVKETQGDYALIEPVPDNIVPAATAVLLKCTSGSTDTKDNRLLPLAPDTKIAPLEGNLLKGVYQLYTSANRTGRVTFDSATMRVFSETEKYGLGFYKMADGTELAANRAYLDLSAIKGDARKVVFRLATGDYSGVEDVAVSGDAASEADAAIYDLQGRRVTEPLAGQIYISGGRKVVIR